MIIYNLSSPHLLSLMGKYSFGGITMANWDMFRQYQSELERIQREIDAEENPYHKQHIKEFSCER
jgi:hypothetical protein